MSLVSFSFLCFLGVVAILYFLAPKRIQWVILLLANFVFYGLAGLHYLPFLLLTIVSVYLGALWLSKINGAYKAEISSADPPLSREEKKKKRAKTTGKKRRVMALICILNFGVLALLKYSGFLLGIFNLLLSTFSLPKLSFSVGWLLPLGISFYTFQAIGYLIDVYRDRVQAERNFFKTALFLSFFPQLVQGPISRYDQLAPQLFEEHRFDYDRVKSGGILLLWGFFKKLMIAEYIATISNWVFDPINKASGFYILLGAAAYSVRVYADFSGGMDIARGAAEILGIDLTLNFERPYFAKTIGDFWRRWHITLGAWFRDYVFYPLSLSKGLSRLGKWARGRIGNEFGKVLPVLIAQFVVFSLIGIWHGASWMYLAFGFYHGILIVGGILLGPKMRKFGERIRLPMESRWFQFYQILRTFLLVILGRVLTMGGRFLESVGFIKSIFPLNNISIFWNGALFQMGLSKKEWLVMALAIGVLFIVSLLQERGMKVREQLSRQILPVRWLIYLLLIFSILIFGVYGFGYESSDFIYRGF